MGAESVVFSLCRLLLREALLSLTEIFLKFNNIDHDTEYRLAKEAKEVNKLGNYDRIGVRV
jgi:hypothetical protein